MFARLTAKLFGTAARTPIRNANRCRLSVEGLEARDVPAIIWSGGGDDTDFNNPDNWNGGVVPHINDDVIFDGNSVNPYSNKDCTNMGLITGSEPGPGGGPGGPGGGPGNVITGHLHGLYIVDAYSGTVTLSAEQSFVEFVLDAPAGAIAQPNEGYVTDISVTGKFTWKDGTLNNSGDDANVFIEGANAQIGVDPEDEEEEETSESTNSTLTTGSTLVFASVQAVGGAITGSTGMVYPGTVNFVGGHGVDVNEFCLLTLAAEVASVRWSTSGTSSNDGKYRLMVKGTCVARNLRGSDYATGTASASLEMPVVVEGVNITNGPNLIVNPNTNLTFEGMYKEYPFGIELSLGSVVLKSGQIRIYNTATLGAEKGMLMMGGSLQAAIRSDAPANNEVLRRANIDGKLTVTGGNVNFSHIAPKGYLSVSKDVLWTGGTYDAYYDPNTSEARAEWRTDGKFTIDGADATLVPDPPLGNNNVPASGWTWSVVFADKGVTGLPQFNKPGYVVEQTNDARFVRIKKS